MKKKLSMRTFVLCGLVFLSGCTPSGFGKKASFKYPDIKEEFCGVQINYQYCKCAFHNQMCDAVNLSKSAANAKVQSEYDKWIAGKLAAFLAACTSAGGIAEKDACQYCKEGYVISGKSCVKPGTEVAQGNDQNDPLYNADCTLRQDLFDKDWKKYSDIDDAIPFDDRSYEAKQALTVYETMIGKMIEAFALERDIEIEKGQQAELEKYRTALVKNIKTNLLSSFWRLAWITYSTIDTTRGLDSSFEKILDLESYAEGIAASLKIIKNGVPSDSVVAIDTDSITGKVKSASASVALDAVESLGDPATIASTIFSEAANASFPSADITDEELAILQAQQLKKGVIDDILKASRAKNAEREAQLATLEKEIGELQPQITEWELKEKTRVATELQESCKTLTTKD